MNNLFKRKKNPEQLVKGLKESLDDLESKRTTHHHSIFHPMTVNHSAENDENSLTRRLQSIKLMLYGEADVECNPQKCAQLAELLVNGNYLIRLVHGLLSLPFEARKHVSQIFNNLIRRDLGNFTSYIGQNPQVIKMLMNGYDYPEIALNCGSMLREVLRCEGLARMVLESEDLWKFFDVYVHLPNFDLASDAFASFKEMLYRHKQLTSDFFEAKFDIVFEKYNKLLESENYVTRRQSIKLLGEILLDRSNFNIMMRYISKRENLKMMMTLLRNKSPNIQFEAFHVFKVFVANPKKPDDITLILINNRDKLIAFLKNFQNDKEDEQFGEEKQLLIKTLSGLEIKPKAENEAAVVGEK